MREITLTQGKVALVDNEFYEAIVAYGSWHAERQGQRWYASRTESEPYKHTLYMHTLVWELSDNPAVPELDHESRDGCDNRLQNLRVATRSQQLENRQKRIRPATSKYKGVSWHAYTQKWQVFVRRLYVGLFTDEIEAAKAYDKKALEIFGKFACLNFPKVQNENL